MTTKKNRCEITATFLLDFGMKKFATLFALLHFAGKKLYDAVSAKTIYIYLIEKSCESYCVLPCLKRYVFWPLNSSKQATNACLMNETQKPVLVYS